MSLINTNEIKLLEDGVQQCNKNLANGLIKMQYKQIQGSTLAFHTRDSYCKLKELCKP